ncbi:hypothetical protein CC53_gp042 [Rhizobium phage vB_RleS_L338C]|uniref:hypothetical protein n=1 Tax=Rhizobium phage vB_RleS_L338C TaxID=1414737 RepID=UPI0003D7D6E0|nr:hypothetical protein CC53_gp042 [Rhizobium phage vB_RleS_L338C]AHC30459.1 hypothetical protein L338C_042 [Rhizobium phage vB_RleS_L338C]QNH72119.1 hypothetical protein P11VFA_101 [Rhizobium phage P11VFA]
MIWFLLYRLDGSIAQHSNAHNEEEAQALAELLDLSLLVLEDQLEDVRDWYVLDGALTQRSEIAAEDTYDIVADGVAEVSFPVPAGTKIFFQREWHVSDGTLAFATDTPGTYTFFVEGSVSHKEKKVTINAV